MTKKLLLPFFFIFLVFNSYSQKETISYTLLEDDPYRISRISIYASPLMSRYDLSNYISLGIEAGASFRIGKKLEVTGNYQHSYLNLGTLISDMADFNYGFEHLQEIKPSLPFTWGEAGVAYVFSDQVRKQPHYMNLHTQSTSQVIINSVLSIESDLRRLRKIRGGFIRTSGMEWMYPGLSTESEQKYYTTDGVEFTNNTLVFPDINYTSLESWEGSGYLNTNPYSDYTANLPIPFTANLFYIGYSSEKIINTMIDVEGHGIRSKRGSSEFFIDLIFGKPNYGNIQFYASDPTATVYNLEIKDEVREYELDEVASEMKPASLGFRMGWMIKSPAFSNVIKWEDQVQNDQRLLYPYLRMSFGMMPSLRLSNSPFMEFTFGASFNL